MANPFDMTRPQGGGQMFSEGFWNRPMVGGGQPFASGPGQIMPVQTDAERSRIQAMKGGVGGSTMFSESPGRMWSPNDPTGRQGDSVGFGGNAGYGFDRSYGMTPGAFGRFVGRLGDYSNTGHPMNPAKFAQIVQHFGGAVPQAMQGVANPYQEFIRRLLGM